MEVTETILANEAQNPEEDSDGEMQCCSIDEPKTCKYCGLPKRSVGHHCSGKKAFDFGFFCGQSEIKSGIEEVLGEYGSFKLAKTFHEIYEEESKKSGWKTQESCQTPFAELPKENADAMRNTAMRVKKLIYDELIINLFGEKRT